MRILFQIVFISGLIFCQTVDQIKQAKAQIKRLGMSETQVRDAAKARGYTDKQIDDAIKKEKNASGNSKISKTELSRVKDSKELGASNEATQNTFESNNEIPSENEEAQLLETYDLEKKEELNFDSKSGENPDSLSYFGYDIFSNDPALFQASSIGAVAPDYLIGPGDEIIVMLWGETQFRLELKVDREGFVFIPEIGQVFVNGLNLNLLESKLFRVFSQSYASLNPQGRKPTTFLDVSLGELRPLRIQVLGEVAQPGAYTVSRSTTLFSSLYYFNGPTTLGSLRDIQLIRDGVKIASIDFYDYLLTGKMPQDQKLQLNDIIFIPRRLKTVSITGEINRKGIYEIKPEENIADLIKIAGDLKVTAYLERSQIDRIVPFEKRADLGMDRMFTDVNLAEILSSNIVFPLQDGDYIQVFSVLDARQNIVDLQGAVTRPGRYDLGDSLKISELINKANGLLGDAYLSRADILRVMPDLNEKLIKINLEKALIGDVKNDITLQGLDKVRIYSMLEMVPETYVFIDGHVKQPGRYILKENMTLYDLIFISGGFLDEEFKKKTYLERAEIVRTGAEDNVKKIIPFNLRDLLEKKDIANKFLRPDDNVRIYSMDEVRGETRYVSISGHVKLPGSYELFEDNMRISDLLFRAGGFEDPYFKSRAFLERGDLIRFTDDGITQKIIPFNLNNILSDKTSEQNFILIPGDRIRIYSDDIFSGVDVVSISGIVNNPGSYNLKLGMTLKDLILESGGMSQKVHRYRIELARIDPTNTDLNQFAEIKTFNIPEKFSAESIKNDADDFLLKPYDLVVVRPDPYYMSQKRVKVSGMVPYPGEYIISSSNEKITDIVARAGGLLSNAYPEASQFIRNGLIVNVSLKKVLRNPKSQLNFNVQDGDEIIINAFPNIVTITGQVNASGLQKHVPGKRLRYYLNQSGGLSPTADKNNIWVEFPGGESKKYRRFALFSPKIPDGSNIIIGEKEEEEPFDKTEYAKEVSAIIASLAQTVAVFLLATRPS